MTPVRPVVLITGASSGIGRATAARLHAAGYEVFGTSRQPTSDTLDGFHMVPLEVTSDDSVAACLGEVRRRTGDRIDVLINNVGTGILGACEESSTEQVRQLFDINLFGAIRMTNGVLPLMRERREGRLLFLSSAGGIVSLPFAGYYCATKHALEAYVEALRLEIEGQGLSASLIAPGTVRTLAGDKAITPDRPREPYASARERVRAEYVEAIHRGMDPDKVAETILHVLRSARTQPRYVVGWQSWGASWAKAVFSPSWVETGVRYLARTATRH